MRSLLPCSLLVILMLASTAEAGRRRSFRRPKGRGDGDADAGDDNNNDVVKDMIGKNVPIVRNVTGGDDGAPGSNRQKKFFSMFQLVRFENDVCEANSDRNGTCYTPEECDERGGSNSGSCADGFGVCCLFALECGDSSNEEVIYLNSDEDDESTDADTNCVYSVCKANDNICRIRLDFETFVIAGPVTASDNAEGAGAGAGDCATDTFAVSAPGAAGSPVICGINTGQHIFVDASEECNLVSFTIGSGSTVNRDWDIKVTQYSCGDDASGPAGCLQFYTETSGTIQSFNFDGGAHLSNQDYTICLRRADNYCSVCYADPTSGVTDSNFGISLSMATGMTGDPTSGAGNPCSSDYIRIPGTTTTTGVESGNLCGRIFGTDDQGAAPAAATAFCTSATPFVVSFHTDGDEVGATGGMASDLEENELAGRAASNIVQGALGFRLTYAQGRC